MPANAGIFFHVLMQIAAFEFYDTDDVYRDLIGKETEPLSPNFGVSGLQSMWFIPNLGTMGIFAAGIPFIYPLLSLLKYCSGNGKIE